MTAITAMSYNELIGLVRETNRPPGGLLSLQTVAQRTLLGPGKKVLEVGCATGWTSIELAQLTGCEVFALDLNADSITEATERASRRGIDNVTFAVADAEHVPLPEGWADVVFCGNVTALVSDANQVFAEYSRVLKPGGLLVAIPMYYREVPSDDLVTRVRRAIQVDIPVLYRDTALDFYRLEGFDVFESHNFAFDTIDEARVDAFVAEILKRPHLETLDAGERADLREVYGRFMQLFRENLAKMGYTILILRKNRVDEDAELFTAHPC